ncbi:PIN domain-containing protein, partial [Azospirillum brasilense]|nr:PIN domain-containing protein [Azospirillum brasilense]
HISAESTQRERRKAPGQNGESAQPFR